MKCYYNDCPLIPDMICGCSTPPIRSCGIHLQDHLETQTQEPHILTAERSRVRLNHRSKQKMLSYLQGRTEALKLEKINLVQSTSRQINKLQKNLAKTLAALSAGEQNPNN